MIHIMNKKIFGGATMAKGALVKGIVVGEFTEELKRAYAKTLARALLEEYGKEKCQKILEGLKK